MSDAVHRYLIAYDVPSDLRRTQLAKTLEAHGDRIQYSVFLIDTRPAKMVRLRVLVTARLDLGSDSLLVCDLGPIGGEIVQRMQFIGAERPITGHGPLVV